MTMFSRSGWLFVDNFGIRKLKTSLWQGIQICLTHVIVISQSFVPLQTWEIPQLWGRFHTEGRTTQRFGCNLFFARIYITFILLCKWNIYNRNLRWFPAWISGEKSIDSVSVLMANMVCTTVPSLQTDVNYIVSLLHDSCPFHGDKRTYVANASTQPGKKGPQRWLTERYWRLAEGSILLFYCCTNPIES